MSPVGFIAVHTGAGNCVDEEKYKLVCRVACLAAIEILRNGGTTLDACETAMIALEDCPETNAGYGSNLTWDRRIECDASIMDGVTLNFGGCSNVSRVRNPIKVARRLCDKQSSMLKFGRIPPMILSGAGAEKFAEDIGIELCEENELISDKALRCFERHKGRIEKYERTENVTISALDTVGAVCVDSNGNAASACSSGGLILKVTGRVGQAATYGAGCWAITSPASGKSAATCTTGNGEYLMKTLLAREIVNDLIDSDCPTLSLSETFRRKFLESPYLPPIQEVYGGALSLIFDVANGFGEVLWSHTTKSMCLGFMSSHQKQPKFVCSTMPLDCRPGKKTVVSSHQFRLSD